MKFLSSRILSIHYNFVIPLAFIFGSFFAMISVYLEFHDPIALTFLIGLIPAVLIIYSKIKLVSFGESGIVVSNWFERQTFHYSEMAFITFRTHFLRMAPSIDLIIHFKNGEKIKTTFIPGIAEQFNFKLRHKLTGRMKELCDKVDLHSK